MSRRLTRPSLPYPHPSVVRPALARVASPRFVLQAALATAVTLFGAQPIFAWGDKGHRVVAIVAEGRLDPATHEAVRSLIGPSTLRDVATWADDIRRDRPETAPWHYVDIPLDRADYDPARDCAHPRNGDCIVGALERFQRVLADARRARAERAEALRFVAHFVADLHQPLHCADNRDRGGNDVEVVFFGEVLNPFSGKPWNLHAVWDAGLIERRGLSVSDYARRLTGRIGRDVESELERGTVVDWVAESHRAAVETSYRLPPDRALGDEYAAQALPVVDDMLAKAGIRLAKILNDALDH
ncbi:MAG: S1/P1 nuclease [Nitrospirota bacterium]